MLSPELLTKVIGVLAREKYTNRHSAVRAFRALEALQGKRVGRILLENHFMTQRVKPDVRWDAYADAMDYLGGDLDANIAPVDGTSQLDWAIDCAFDRLWHRLCRVLYNGSWAYKPMLRAIRTYNAIALKAALRYSGMRDNALPALMREQHQTTTRVVPVTSSRSRRTQFKTVLRILCTLPLRQDIWLLDVVRFISDHMQFKAFGGFGNMMLQKLMGKQRDHPYEFYKPMKNIITRPEINQQMIHNNVRRLMKYKSYLKMKFFLPFFSKEDHPMYAICHGNSAEFDPFNDYFDHKGLAFLERFVEELIRHPDNEDLREIATEFLQKFWDGESMIDRESKRAAASVARIENIIDFRRDFGAISVSSTTDEEDMDLSCVSIKDPCADDDETSSSSSDSDDDEDEYSLTSMRGIAGWDYDL